MRGERWGLSKGEGGGVTEGKGGAAAVREFNEHGP